MTGLLKTLVSGINLNKRPEYNKSKEMDRQIHKMKWLGQNFVLMSLTRE